MNYDFMKVLQNAALLTKFRYLNAYCTSIFWQVIRDVWIYLTRLNLIIWMQLVAGGSNRVSAFGSVWPDSFIRIWDVTWMHFLTHINLTKLENSMQIKWTQKFYRVLSKSWIQITKSYKNVKIIICYTKCMPNISSPWIPSNK